MAKKKGSTYADMHGSLMKMNEADIEAALHEEMNRTDRPPRVDLVGRLLGRHNRLRANRIHFDMMALVREREAGKRDVSAVLHKRVARTNQA